MNMYVTTLHGPGALEVKCTSTVCYGADGTGYADSEIKRMQKAINRFAPSLKMSPISIDGKVGDSTFNLAKKTVLDIYSWLPFESASLIPTLADKSTIAEAATQIADVAESAANIKGLPKVVIPAPAPIPSGPISPIPSTSSMPAIDFPFDEGRSAMWPWYVGGGTLVAGVIAVIMSKRSQTSPTRKPEIKRKKMR